MPQEAVKPLRINKSNSLISPSKMMGAAPPRPLSEISPMGVRRNSPSYNQATKIAFTQSSSPFDRSPGNSRLLFWKDRDAVSPTQPGSENTPPRHSAQSPNRQTSLEKLRQASRVKNSNMFAREHSQDYDPDDSSIVERPLANGRPLSAQVRGNTWGVIGLEGMRKENSARGHRRTESNSQIPLFSPQNFLTSPNKATSLLRSPQKSSLSINNRYAAANAFNQEDGTWSDGDDSGSGTRATTPRALRQPKNVSFDAAPPQVNEYEMVTPDPSSVASGSREGSYESDAYDMDESFERRSPVEREDSFDDSLVDTDKTPVVLPGEWRFMSPEAVNTGLARTFDDPFESVEREGTSSPSTMPQWAPHNTEALSRSDSINSDGSRRPLPPLPGVKLMTTNQGSYGSRRCSNSVGLPPSPQRVLPTPPRPASVSKAEILAMRAPSVTLEERLKLLALEEHEQDSKPPEAAPKTEALEEKQIEDQTLGIEHEVQIMDISKDNILKELHEPLVFQTAFGNTVCLDLDPDVPILSRETSSNYGDEETRVVKREEDDEQSIIDMYNLPESSSEQEQSSFHQDNYARESSVIHHDIYGSNPDEQEDEFSIHEETTVVLQEEPQITLTAEDTHSMPELDEPIPATFNELRVPDQNRMSLPELTSSFGDDDFGSSFLSYMTPSPPAEREQRKDIGLTRIGDTVQRPATPEDQLHPPQAFRNDSFEEDVRTPDSVIHHPFEPEWPLDQSPTIPEPVATIKASGGKLKTRPSATPADIHAMIAARRHVSGEKPPISVLHRSRSSYGDTAEVEAKPKERTAEPFLRFNDNVPVPITGRQSTEMRLDVPLSSPTEELGFGLNEEFDRLIEVQKVELSLSRASSDFHKGYLMRQNTKVVVASNRQFSTETKITEQLADHAPTTTARGARSAGNSPRKSSVQTWTTEPWNGRTRRQSTRKTQINSENGMSLGPVPPLPGYEGNLSPPMDTVTESQLPVNDSQVDRERGRLFVKVIGLKDLNLPLPKNGRSWFQLTLDNGMHCVTTAHLQLGKTAPIGQEFELVVFDDLEFQLTLSTKLERPKSQPSSLGSQPSSISPTKSLKSSKPSALSRLLTSPKKRREQERKQQEEEALAEQQRVQMERQRVQEFEAKRAAHEPNSWDLQHELVGPDGSFGRAYVSLKDHERQAFGQPYLVDEICWNEWAIADEMTASSTRSKLGGIKRRPPYQVAKLELQLLYVPKPKGVKDEDMPKSISACVRQLKEAEANATRQFEGHLSQQGGDCPYWRRRFFKLNGSKLTAFHESTRQPRATINLTKATKLIDDRSALTQAEGPGKSGRSRRKSAFAEDEEGYMFVEEGFRIRFANGEIIDFYADNAAQKLEWMKVLSEAVGKDLGAAKAGWVDAVMAREKVEKAEPRTYLHSSPPKRMSSSRIATSPEKRVVDSRTSTLTENKPPPIDKSPRHSQVSPVKSPMKKQEPPGLAPPPKQRDLGSGRRAAVRSMIF